jgi:ribonucleoside-diphosphate reductase alpha chain
LSWLREPAAAEYLSLSRYALLGMLKIPEGLIKPTALKPLTGKVRRECGNAPFIKKDGCKFCTSCGAIGTCG